MMRNFCKAHTFSRSLFSTYRSEGKCQERRRISEFLKDVYLQNISNVAHILQKSDLKFANLVAYNASQLGIEDEGFKTLIASRISEELENLTPDLAFELVLNLRDLVAFDNPDIYETIYNYCQTYYYLFDQKQLEIIEKVFYSMGGGKFSFSENVFHEERHFSAKAKTKYETREQTKSVLDLYGINVPHDELEVVVRPYKKVIEIKFKKAQKTLTLAGIMHEDWGAVAKVKDLINQNDFDFYLMELGPITHSDTIKNKKAERKNNSKSKSNKEFIIDKFLNEYSQSTDQENKARRSSYLEYFDKYDRMALLDAPLLKWYTDTILHNSDVYQIMDAERVVYTENSGIKKPNELETIMYVLNMLEKKDIKVLLSDLRVYDEVNILNNKMDLNETKELFRYARFLWLNEFVRWGLAVNKKGCPYCSKSNRDPPMDIINLISHKRYNFEVRERFITKQIVDAIENFSEHKNYVGFYGEEHIYEIVRFICEHYSREPSELKLPTMTTNEEIFKKFLRLEEIRVLHDVGSNVNKEENTNKFSMLMSLFQLNRAKFLEVPYEANLDWPLYEVLRKEYLKFLSLDSFTFNTEDIWQVRKQEERCYAVNLMFYQQSQ